MAQDLDIGDGLTTISDHHRDIEEHPTPIVDGGEAAPGQRLGQLTGQTGPITEQA